MSNNEKTFTHYRIGDFAKYLGVTSDFLKHYEEAGLIDVVQRASGYRYYPFNLSSRCYVRSTRPSFPRNQLIF